MKKIKIQIKNRFTGSIIFEYESEENTVAKTVNKYIEREGSYANLRSADLSSANLRYANLRSADLSSANLRYADLSSADLSYTNLSYTNLRYANLRYADLSSANLSYTNLSSANLRSADLSYTNLRYADLSYTNLRYTNLRYANLSSANLRYADLSSADLDKRYIQVSCIGSEKRTTTYCFDDDIIWCGCFIGTLKEFETQIKETHKDNGQYLKEYLGFVNYVKSIQLC